MGKQKESLIPIVISEWTLSSRTTTFSCGKRVDYDVVCHENINFVDPEPFFNNPKLSRTIANNSCELNESFETAKAFGIKVKKQTTKYYLTMKFLNYLFITDYNHFKFQEELNRIDLFKSPTVAINESESITETTSAQDVLPDIFSFEKRKEMKQKILSGHGHALFETLKETKCSPAQFNIEHMRLKIEDDEIKKTLRVGQHKEFEEYSDQAYSKKQSATLIWNLQKLTSFLNKSLILSIFYYFVVFPHFFFLLVDYFVAKKAKNFKLLVDYLHSKGEVEMAPEKVLFLKEFNQMTDDQYVFYRKHFLMEHRLPDLNKLRNCTKRINKEVADFVELETKPNGCVCDPEKTLNVVYEAMANHKKLYEETQSSSKHGDDYKKIDPITEQQLLKNSSDAYEDDGVHYTVLAYQSMKQEDYLPCKNGSSWIPVGIFATKESEIERSSIQKMTNFNSNPQKQLTISSLNLTLSFFVFWVSDLLTLTFYSDLNFEKLPCIYCHFLCDSKNPFFNFFLRPFNNCLGLMYFFFCRLHCFQRICERITYNHTNGDKTKKETLLNIFKQHPPTKHVKFVDKDAKKHRHDENLGERLSMMTGNCFKFLLDNPQVLLPIFSPGTLQLELRIWVILKTIFNFMALSPQFYTIPVLIHVQCYLDELMHIYYMVFKLSAPLYLHYMCKHLVPLLLELKRIGLSFADIDQSSFEHNNAYLKALRKGCISKTPKKKEIKKETQEKYEKNSWFSWQRFLNFKENMTFMEYEEYKKRFITGQLMLLRLRFFWLVAKYPQFKCFLRYDTKE